MNIPNILGWIANIAFLIGGLHLIGLRRSGWLLYAFANALYAIQAVMLSLSSLFIISIWLIGVDLYGYWKWKK